MMEEIRFNDSNKCIHISIDNETQEIPIFEIDRLETYIILKDIIDAPLNEKINISPLSVEVKSVILTNENIQDQIDILVFQRNVIIGSTTLFAITAAGF